MQIAIVGAGTMGARVARAVALYADQVVLHDSDDASMRRALAGISRGLEQDVTRGTIDRSRARRARRVFRLAETLEECAGAGIVIEAVKDDLVLKHTLLHALEEVIQDSTLIATTTQAHSIASVAGAIHHPERVIGLHFAGSAPSRQLVEVVRAPRTSADTLERVQSFLRAIGKTPLVVPDTPGQVLNRMAQTYIGEALQLLDDGGGLEFATIDRLMEAAGFTQGPFRLTDLLGVDTVFTLSRAIFEATYHAAPYRPHIRLQQLVDAGRVGRDKPGFYDRPALATPPEK
ncbi:MAG: 3-hydroxyacyl-CoA dehydrogenase family protein [Chloroflexi bacterium]|nr:3-hydroxyacyl-CoA dehydrogenase family protein [Chloroflexota bacterium]